MSMSSEMTEPVGTCQKKPQIVGKSLVMKVMHMFACVCVCVDIRYPCTKVGVHMFTPISSQIWKQVMGCLQGP